MKNTIKPILRVTLLVTAALFGFIGCTGTGKNHVTSVESMTLTLRGMRGGTVYEIAEADGKTVLRLYREVYTNGEIALEPECEAVCETAEFLALLNDCSVMRWNGFHGKHPRNVSDGIMFRFTASVNGGQTIEADGSANFPKGYHEFVRSLNKMLEDSENH